MILQFHPITKHRDHGNPGALQFYGSNTVSVSICYQRNRLTSKVGLFEYQVLNGKLIVPAGCENSSVRYCSVSTPFA